MCGCPQRLDLLTLPLNVLFQSKLKATHAMLEAPIAALRPLFTSTLTSLIESCSLPVKIRSLRIKNLADPSEEGDLPCCGDVTSPIRSSGLGWPPNCPPSSTLCSPQAAKEVFLKHKSDHATLQLPLIPRISSTPFALA